MQLIGLARLGRDAEARTVGDNVVANLTAPSGSSGVTINEINIVESGDARRTASEVVRAQRDAMFLAGV